MRIFFREIATVGMEKSGFYFFENKASLQHVELTERIPPINWATEVLVGVFMGEKRTAGYYIRIDRVERVRQKIIVYVEEQIPKPGQMLAQVYTYPGQIVALQRRDLPTGGVEVNFQSNTGCEQTLKIAL